MQRAYCVAQLEQHQMCQSPKQPELRRRVTYAVVFCFRPVSPSEFR